MNRRGVIWFGADLRAQPWGEVGEAPLLIRFGRVGGDAAALAQLAQPEFDVLDPEREIRSREQRSSSSP
jgi:hypothetical protein